MEDECQKTPSNYKLRPKADNQTQQGSTKTHYLTEYGVNFEPSIIVQHTIVCAKLLSLYCYMILLI